MRLPSLPMGALSIRRLSWRYGPVAFAADMACLVAFVILGRQAHEPGSGAGRVLTVLWPFVAGWLLAATATGLYWARRRRWSLPVTIVAAISLALLLRATLTHRGVTVAFTIVAVGFISLFTCGWRLLAHLASGRRPPRAS